MFKKEKKIKIFLLFNIILILIFTMFTASPQGVQPLNESGGDDETYYYYRKTLVDTWDESWSVSLVHVHDNYGDLPDEITVSTTFTFKCSCTVSSGRSYGVSPTTFSGQAGTRTGVTCGWSWTYHVEYTFKIAPHKRGKIYLGTWGKVFKWKVEKVDASTGEVVQTWYDIHRHATCEYTKKVEEPLP